MKVAETPPKAFNMIDYNEVATLYNRLEIGATALQMDKVYNITLFKQRLVSRGLEAGKDFEAFTSGGYTYVKRLTRTLMNKD